MNQLGECVHLRLDEEQREEGELLSESDVTDVQHAPNDQNLHFVDLILPVEKGQEYVLKLDKERREGLRHSHSAT